MQGDIEDKQPTSLIITPSDQDSADADEMAARFDDAVSVKYPSERNAIAAAELSSITRADDTLTKDARKAIAQLSFFNAYLKILVMWLNLF